MKIDDVSLTIFTWDGIPVAHYHQGALSSSESNLGLLRIRTDAGLEGHAFLGSAMNPASMDGPQLLRSLKPLLIGQNPLDRERIHSDMRLISRVVSYRTIGAVDVALWDLAGKIANLPVHALMGTYRASIMGYASSQSCPMSPPILTRRRNSRPRAGVPTRSTHHATLTKTSRSASPYARRWATISA